MERGYSYTRWRTIANTILFKDDDNVRLHRTRVIHIYEADFNLALGIKRRVSMHQAEAFKVLNSGQFGSRPRRNATDPVFIEELQCEISRATRKTALVLTNYDAASCYDRIIPNVAILASRKYGVSPMVTKMNSSTLEQAEYGIRTELGLSETGYTHTATHPIYGTGQGSANSPAIWCFLLCTFFDGYDSVAKLAHYSNPKGTVHAALGMIGFVDDCNGQAILLQEPETAMTVQEVYRTSSKRAVVYLNSLNFVSCDEMAIFVSRCPSPNATRCSPSRSTTSRPHALAQGAYPRIIITVQNTQDSWPLQRTGRDSTCSIPPPQG